MNHEAQEERRDGERRDEERRDEARREHRGTEGNGRGGMGRDASVTGGGFMRGMITAGRAAEGKIAGLLRTVEQTPQLLVALIMGKALRGTASPWEEKRPIHHCLGGAARAGPKGDCGGVRRGSGPI